MNHNILLPIIVTGFSIAFFHAAIPTHWLPFVMAARAQRWSKSKTLGVTALAGGGHVLFTTILGILIVWLGIKIDEKVGHWFPIIAGGVLILFGLYYLIQQLRGQGHSHSHFSFGTKHKDHGHNHDHNHNHDHDHGHGHKKSSQSLLEHIDPDEARKKPMSDKVAILSLLAMLTFSPCEGFLPVYLSAISYGWIGFALLSMILALATLLGMVIFTWLTLAGMEKLKLSFLERYESGLMGAILCMLGLGVILFE